MSEKDGVIYDRPDDMIDDENNRYSCTRYLAKGGFGKVYEVIKNGDRTRRYCGKFLRKPVDDRKINSGLLKEMSIHNNLRHDNVVRLRKFVQDDKFDCLILDYCENKSLSVLIKRRKGLSEPEIRYFGVQIVNGLRYLHAKNIVHRDIKPHNILLDSRMTAKIADFGLAVTLPNRYARIRKTKIVGTPNYISPEMIDNNIFDYDNRVDIWAIGCLLYDMFEGCAPFTGEGGIDDIYRRILIGRYNVPSTMSKSLAALIGRLLQLNPRNRLRIEEIIGNGFFNANFVPKILPRSAMIEKPQFIIKTTVRNCNNFNMITTTTTTTTPTSVSRNSAIYCTGSCRRHDVRKLLSELIRITTDNRLLTNWKESDLEIPNLKPIVWVKNFYDYTGGDDLTTEPCVAYKFNDGTRGALYTDGTSVILLSEKYNDNRNNSRDNNIFVQYHNPALQACRYVRKVEFCSNAVKMKVNFIKSIYPITDARIKPSNSITTINDSTINSIADTITTGYISSVVRSDYADCVCIAANVIYYKNRPDCLIIILSNGLLQIVDKMTGRQILICPRLRSLTVFAKSAENDISVTYGIQNLKKFGQPKYISDQLVLVCRNLGKLLGEKYCFLCNRYVLRKARSPKKR